MKKYATTHSTLIELIQRENTYPPQKKKKAERAFMLLKIKPPSKLSGYMP